MTEAVALSGAPARARTWSFRRQVLPYLQIAGLLAWRLLQLTAYGLAGGLPLLVLIAGLVAFVLCLAGWVHPA